MPLEKGSLILVDYTARVKDTNDVFDTTREEEAKKTNFYDPTHKYEPRIVSIGESLTSKCSQKKALEKEMIARSG
jgi:peptidylprolyl isomerase